MLLVDPLLTLYALAGLPLLLLGLLLLKNAQRRAQQALSRKNANLNAYTQESLIGMKVTQVFAREDVNRGIYHRLNQEYRRTWMKSAMLNQPMWPFIDTVSNCDRRPALCRRRPLAARRGDRRAGCQSARSSLLSAMSGVSGCR